MKKAIAFIFQRKGVTEMKKEDFIYDPATDLGWFSISESKDLLETAKEKGLVKESKDKVSVNFDHLSVGFPVGFKPTKRILKVDKKEPLLPRMLSAALNNSRYSRSELMAAVNKKQDEMNLEIEVALLLLCSEEGIELPEKRRYIGEIKKKIRLGTT